MRRSAHLTRVLPLILILIVSSVLLSGCDYFSSPQNTFAPEGTVAQQQKDDFLFVMWPALVIGVGVMVGIVFIAFKFRRKKGDPGLPKQVHGNTTIELTWTILPALLLAVIAVPTVAGIRELSRDAEAGALPVQVEGQRFSWTFTYPDIDVGGEPLFTIGEMYIPTDREIDLLITSIDVNHSFWVPKLAGKTDAIQNHPNSMWIEATKPGIYEGQCAEFCGLEHANMRLRVIAMPQEEFDAWVEEQRAQAAADAAGGDDNEVGLAGAGE